MGIKGTEIKNFAKFIQKNRVLSNILRKKIVENISARYLICGNKNDKIVVDTLNKLVSFTFGGGELKARVSYAGGLSDCPGTRSTSCT